MSKFCANCGEELQDDAMFCGKCGSRQPEQQIQPEQKPVQIEQQPAETGNTQSDTAPKTSPVNGMAEKVNAFIGKVKSKDTKAIGILAGVAAALIIIVVVVCVVRFSGGGPGSALDDFIDVTYNGKINKLESIAPAEYWASMKDSTGLSFSKMKALYEEIYDDRLDDLEDLYGEDVKASVKVTVIDDVSKSTLSNMKDYLKRNYDIPKKSVEEAKELEFDITIRGDDDKDTDEETCYAVKIDGDWYICLESGNFAINSYFSRYIW